VQAESIPPLTTPTTPTAGPTPEPLSLKHELQCPHGDLLQFWKPPTAADLRYKTPYEEAPGQREKYVTFEPGGSGGVVCLHVW
jgi:hypothetical protein